ncbi:hypothetical protein ABBQ38_008415 [Trebouxia sp. C0009 RCD-2024]
MQPHEAGRGGPGPPRLDPELEQRLRQAGYGGVWQPGIAFAGQYGASYGLPYALAPAFPSQAQLGYLTPAGDRFPGAAQGIPWNQAQRPASALGQRTTAPVPRVPANQFAGFYPQGSAGYSVQYLPQAGQWRPMPAQQAPPLQGPLPPYAFPAGQSYPQQQGRPQGRQGGRLPQRGRPNRHPGLNRAQGRGQYRAMWQEVNQVAQGQDWQSSMRHRSGHLSVEDLIFIVQRLPPGMSPIPAVAQGLHSVDSRACAAFLKDLSKVGLPHHAITIFDWLQSLPPENDLARLCDVFTYTTVISLCGQWQELGKALTLVADMRGRGITPNIHTYTALINTCIRSGDHTLALDVFKTLQEEGSRPTVVTYNTLIDVYGKMGRWEDAVKVLSDMVEEGCQPETRTFNTAIIACNMCSQPAQALQVHERMLEQGLQPTATTYTALVSAHCKSDNMDAALEVYNVMMARRLERNIITYSSLLAAADRAGRWEEGLTIWGHLSGDRCHPNLPAYNSAISCCAQGGRWQQAQEIFEQVKQARFKPDVSTYTALLAAYHPANKWRPALQVDDTPISVPMIVRLEQVFEQMQAASIRPETVLYAAVIDLLWMSGIVGAQQRAQQLFQLACRQSVRGMEVSQAAAQEADSQLEVSVDAPVPSIAALAMHKWLQDLHSKVQNEGPSCVPKRVVLPVGLWVGTPGRQTSPQAPARVETSPLEPPEEQGAGSSQRDAQTSAQALTQEPAAAAAAAGPAAAAAAPTAAAGSNEAGPSSATVPTESSSRSPHLGQKRTAPGLPTVAAKVFGPEYTAAANQAAVLGMVRGLGCPSRLLMSQMGSDWKLME